VNQWLADILGDTRDFRDDSAMVSGGDDSHDLALLQWAAKKPAMDAGLIPHEPRPTRPAPRTAQTVRVMADRACMDGELMRLFDIPKQYPVSESVVRGWWSHHKINGEVLYDGTNSLTLFYRDEIEAALKTWKPGTRAESEITIDDDGVPSRIASAARDFRTEATSPSSGVVHDGPVAAARQGRSRHCGTERGLHGCGPDFTAPRVGKERQARGATLAIKGSDE